MRSQRSSGGASEATERELVSCAYSGANGGCAFDGLVVAVARGAMSRLKPISRLGWRLMPGPSATGVLSWGACVVAQPVSHNKATRLQIFKVVICIGFFLGAAWQMLHGSPRDTHQIGGPMQLWWGARCARRGLIWRSVSMVEGRVGRLCPRSTCHWAL